MRGSQWIIAALIGMGSFSAHAEDFVTQAMQDAYVPYRVALFKSNAGSIAEAQQAIAKAEDAWRLLQQRLNGSVSPPYAHDADFGADLLRVGLVYKEAAQKLSDNDKAGAHEALEKIRDILSDLRQRNDVVVFSDYMNAYHEQMEQVLTEGPKLLNEPEGQFELILQVGALDYLARRLNRDVSGSLRGNAEFQGLMVALQASVTALKNALASHDINLVKAALAGLKSPYARLFVKFG